MIRPLALPVAVLSFVLLAGVVIVAYGSSPQDITFPVSELGGCESKDACKSYCDEPSHYDSCIAFAKEHKLMSESEAAHAEKFAQIIKNGGPGGCASQRACEAFCENIKHMDACLAFAEEHGFLGDEELAEARKVQAALKKGAALPGGCESKAQCEAYCSEGIHMEECVAFAEAAGFMSKQEAEEARRIAPLMARGEMPGGCRSKEACEAYCSDWDHFEECVAFAEKAGFMTSEDAAMARKTGGKGPGDCRSREACEAYCNEPDHMQMCFDFAREHGMLSPEDEERMREGLQQLQEGLEKAPPEVRECLEHAMGPETVEQIKNRQFMPGPEIGAAMRECFEKFMSQQHGGMKLENIPPDSSGDLLLTPREPLLPASNFPSFPPETHACLKQLYGEDVLERLSRGEWLPPSDVTSALQNCIMQQYLYPR